MAFGYVTPYLRPADQSGDSDPETVARRDVGRDASELIDDHFVQVEENA